MLSSGKARDLIPVYYPFDFSYIPPVFPYNPSVFPISSVRTPIVALAASAGGIHALSVVLSALPEDFPAPILIAQHISPSPRSELADLLSRLTALRVKEVQEGDSPQTGWVYATPSGSHLQVCSEGTLSLTRADRVGLGRPSADLLFGSLAESVGPKAVAVVLTGTGRDGARGVQAVKAVGGIVVAQDAASSEFPGMPRSAVVTGCVDFVLPLEEISPTLVKILAAPVPLLDTMKDADL